MHPLPHPSAKKEQLFLLLTGIFITHALLAELVGVKIFSLEKLLGTPPAQIKLLANFTLDFNLTAGVILWPVVFLTTDLINEYFGQRGVKKVSFLTAGLIAFAFVAIYAITHLPPADFWLAIHQRDAHGQPFDINHAFQSVFSQSLSIIIGSLAAFLVGQLLDAYVFQKFKSLTGHKMIWLRATGSTLISQLLDSFAVLFIAFYLLAPEQSRWSIEQVIAVGTVNYTYKFVVAVLLTPLLYLSRYFIHRYLGKSPAAHPTIGQE